MVSDIYISLELIAIKLKLPKKYIRQRAEVGDIPCLNVNGRLRAQEQSVREALSKLENQTSESGEITLFKNLCNARKDENITGVLKSNHQLNKAGVSVQFAEATDG